MPKIRTGMCAIVAHIAAETARLEALVATTGRSIALLKERRAHRRGSDGAD
ncbi:hypothetical protein [Candidatus Amarolinea aalborgensis]|jgi:hypothetical protein|uniref:hypothetical protein n=1 Tax=Candidatus Amarolinea aalborgensis TaxID=2249329 RepID=UPI003BF97ED3